MKSHENHPAIVKRLKRAKGHLEKVISMIESHTPCLDVAQQFHAVSRSVFNAKQAYVKEHIDSCLNKESLSNAKELEKTVAEFKKITKYLE